MTEQEKQAGEPNQFPRIPKELVDRLFKEVHSEQRDQIRKERDNFRAEIEKEEPMLMAAIESVADAYGDSVGITAGAIVIYKLFKESEQLGFASPRVSEDVVLTLTNEYLHAGEPPQDTNLFFTSHKTGIELSNPVLSPYHYAEENPHLMVFLAMLPEHLQIGGMLVYELKRRQYHADQLTAQFGDK